MKYYTINLFNKNLTECVEVISINIDGTINTVETNRLMLLKTLITIGYTTQKEAEKEAVINFVKSNKLFRDTEYYDYVNTFAKKHYPELVI